MQDVLQDVFHDALPMIPFLFLTYLLMEYLEHKSNDRFQKRLESARALGPLIGGILGIVPQCGFSVLASGLYMNRSISLGTLLAVFISTSVEAISKDKHPVLFLPVMRLFRFWSHSRSKSMSYSLLSQ